MPSASGPPTPLTASTAAIRAAVAVAVGAAVAAAALAPAASAQQRFPHNKLEHTNWWLDAREDLFPNFLAAGGNVAGDGLFKVVPAEVLERDGDHLVSGYRVAISIDDAYTGPYPTVVNVPAMQLHRTRLQTIAGTTYETLDPSQPVGPRFDPVRVVLPSDNAWVVEVAFDPQAQNAKLRSLLSIPARPNGQRAGLAILALAEAGQARSATVPGITLVPSFQERHLPPGRPTYSGSYDARTATVAMYGTTGQPSATGELYLALRFASPTLQVFSDSSGGVRNDPQNLETHLGPGAYATDLASRSQPGFFGLYVQAEQHDPGGQPATHHALPFVVATSAGGPTASLELGSGVRLRVDPAALGAANLFVGAGLHGGLQRYVAAGAVGFDEDQRGVWHSGRLPLVPDPALVGLALWLQALVVDQGLQPVDTTNVVRLTLQ